MEYTISKHAKERYAERIMDKESTADINKFIIEHENKIHADINKMIEYGNLIFQGKQKRDNRVSNISVYIKDLWIVLCDTAKENVITLYKVDLGLDSDFNQQYVYKMLEKLENSKKAREEICMQLINETNKYSSIIQDNNALINEYKGYIKNLEELNASYKNIIEHNTVQIDIAEKEVAKVVNDLIGKKEF